MDLSDLAGCDADGMGAANDNDFVPSDSQPLQLHTILLQDNLLREYPPVLRNIRSLKVVQLHGNPYCGGGNNNNNNNNNTANDDSKEDADADDGDSGVASLTEEGSTSRVSSASSPSVAAAAATKRGTI